MSLEITESNLISQVKKLRLREAKQNAQSHTVKWWQSFRILVLVFFAIDILEFSLPPPPIHRNCSHM